MIRVKIKEHSLFARLAAYKLKGASAAIVFGNTIHLWNMPRKFFLQNNKWVLHELEHVRQYKKYGFTKFILLYLVESLYKGYYKNKFEVAARLAEHSETSFPDMIIL